MREKERGDEGGTTAQSSKLESGGSAFGVTGLSRFCLPCPVFDTITRRESNRTSKIDRDLNDLEE